MARIYGGRSSAQLASRPAGLLLMDETDKFAEDDEGMSSRR